MKKTFLLLLFVTPLLLLAQDYNVALLSESLTKNANAVKRLEELRVIIKSPSKAIIKKKVAITILNEEGEQFANYSTTYSKMFATYKFRWNAI